jgi:hypothetical protein
MEKMILKKLSDDEAENLPDIILGIFLNEKKELRGWIDKNYFKEFKGVVKFNENVKINFLDDKESGSNFSSQTSPPEVKNE